MPRIRCVAPVLCLSEMGATRDVLIDKLGFKIQGTAGDPPTWMSLQRDGVELMLVAGDYPAPAQDWAAYLYVENVDELYAEFLAHGADLKGPPVDQPYNNREFEVRLPDGRTLVFGG